MISRYQLSTLLVLLTFIVSIVPAQQPSKTLPVFTDGQAQIVSGFQDASQWIREQVWVEAEFDSDGDGKKDRLRVDITRPRQTETEGLKVPVVYESSPYYSGTARQLNFFWPVKYEVGAEPPKRTPAAEIPFNPNRDRVATSLINQWVPRGFAVIHSEAPGTGLSQGCPTVGGEVEARAPKDVIDWLNGRAKAYKTIDGMETVTASWTTGKVGMTGTSYNGTTALAAATTGVKGLEAIIPVAPVSSYYHYYRSNGLVRNPAGYPGEDVDVLYDFIHSGDPSRRKYCDETYRDGEFAKGKDRVTGDYNKFWVSRDYLPNVKNIKAAVLMAHAFHDLNVVPENSFRVINQLKAQGTPLQIFYHQGGHGGPPPMTMMNRWFTRYLYGVENGVEKDAKAWIVREGAKIDSPTAYGDYPNPDSRGVQVFPFYGGTGTGALTLKKGNKTQEKLVDDAALTTADLAKMEESRNRLLYLLPTNHEPVHLSGTTRVTVKLASSKPAANLTVTVVALPWEGTGFGGSYVETGWADPQNYKSLTKGGNYDSLLPGEPLKPGQFVTVTFDLQPIDQIIPAGTRLGIMIRSSDPLFTILPAAGTELTVDLDGTSFILPVVGGSTALTKAFSAPAP